MTKHFSAADGIRGVACLIVVILHNVSKYLPTIGQYTKGCEKYGVWIFFTLSAFLLSVKLMNKEPTFPEYAKYIISRFFRIIPPFVVAVFTYYYMGYMNYQKMIDTISFNSSYFHFWTIPVEFKFYFTLPLFLILFLVADKIKGIMGGGALLFLLILLVQNTYPYNITIENSIQTLPYLSVFLFGVFSAVLHCRHNIKVSNAMGDSIILLIISILFIISPGVIENVFRFQPIDLMNKYVFLGILFTILIFILCNTSGYSAVFFSNKAFRFR